MERAAKWQQAPFDKETQNNVNILSSDEKALEDAFYTDLTFGTGGMRGIMGVGTNRVNRYTFGRTTQGLSNYINHKFQNNPNKVIIGYDCRHQSDALAQTVADIFSANNIKVYLFSSLRPTPEVSFAVRYLGAQCGIVLTASHNPPEYNGYKVYWEDGGQIVPPHDNAIIKEINKVDFSDIQFTSKPKNIELVGKEIDDAFQTACVKNGRLGNGERSNLNIVFTSLHGTSITAIPDVLQQAGYTQVHVVEEQAEPNGDFPTVESPNPEEPAALALALQKAKETNADIVIGTDPDADRLGIAVRNPKGEMELLNGNQTMIVMTQFILDHVKREKNKQYFIGSTIVSTPMMPALAAHYKVNFKMGLTGFKWIAKMIKDFPTLDFIGGGEESFGFMVGDFVRDKDAITSALVACEVGSECKSKGINMIDYLIDCYIKYGFFKEKLISIEKKGAEGLKEISSIMNKLRNYKIKSLDGSKLISFKDFQSSQEINQISGEINILNFPKSNVLIFESEDGTTVAARPSGTEPKIKFYISVNTVLKSKDDYNRVNQILNDKIVNLTKEFNF